MLNHSMLRKASRLSNQASPFTAGAALPVGPDCMAAAMPAPRVDRGRRRVDRWPQVRALDMQALREPSQVRTLREPSQVSPPHPEYNTGPRPPSPTPRHARISKVITACMFRMAPPV